MGSIGNGCVTSWPNAGRAYCCALFVKNVKSKHQNGHLQYSRPHDEQSATEGAGAGSLQPLQPLQRLPAHEENPENSPREPPCRSAKKRATMGGLAKICQDMPKYAQIWQNMCKYVPFKAPNMPKYAQICSNMFKYAQICLQKAPKIIRKHCHHTSQVIPPQT